MNNTQTQIQMENTGKLKSIAAVRRLTAASLLPLAAALSLGLYSTQAAAFDLFGLFSSDEEQSQADQQAQDIETVKNGVLQDYSTTVRVGPALEHYFDCLPNTAKWTGEQSARGERLVHFTCSLKGFKEELTDLGFLQNLGMLSAGLNAFFSDPGKGTDSLKEAGELSEQAAKNLQSVDLKVSFVMSVVEDKAFEPRSVDLTLNYPSGLADYSLKVKHLKQIFDDKTLFDPKDEEILGLIAEIPSLYQKTQPQQSSGQAI